MLWMEYQMRLANDASEGTFIKNFNDAKRVHDGLVQNINALKAKFGLMHTDHSPEQSKQISQEFRNQLGKVLESYYEIQRSLAADNVPDRLVVAVAAAQVAGQDFAHPVKIADDHRLIESIVLLELLNLVLRQRLVLAADGRGSAGLGVHHLRFHHGTLQRSARDEPRDDEDQDGDTKERGGNEDQTPQEIVAHTEKKVARDTSGQEFRYHRVSDRGQSETI